MYIELTEEESDIIQRWYMVSAGESGHCRSSELFALLEKLGFSADSADLWILNPPSANSKFVPDHEAIMSYRERHPDDPNVLATIRSEKELENRKL